MKQTNRLVFFVLIAVAIIQCNGDFSYPSFKRIAINDLALVGDTFINKSVSWVQLTSRDSSLARFSNVNSLGAMVYPSPIHLFDISKNGLFSFTTCFSFSILSNYSYSGEGFSFFISPNVPSQTHPSVAIFGLPKTFFAVVFDTRSADSTSISIYLNNSHAAPLTSITIDEQVMDLKSGATFYSWIEYQSSVNLFSVYLTKTKSKPSIPFLSATTLDLFDIFKDNTYLYTGFSAFSLNKNEIYSIHSWNFTSIYEKPPTKSSTKLISTFMLVVVGLIAAALIMIMWSLLRRYQYISIPMEEDVRRARALPPPPSLPLTLLDDPHRSISHLD